MTTQVIKELDNLIQLLESDIPGNPNAPRNQKLAKELAGELADYFKSLEQAFPFDALEQIYYKHVAKESFKEAEPVGDAEDLLAPILAAFRTTLFQRLNNRLLAIYLSGSAEMINWGKTKGGIPIAFEGPPIKQAIDYARDHCAKLVTQMDDETKTRLAKVISDGIQNKRGIDGLARDIRNEFADMTRYRSKIIAQNETSDALGQSFLDRGEEMGIDGKEWILGAGGVSGNCEICIANADDGIIPFGQAFSGGVTVYPQHVGCTCGVAPARLPK